MTYKLRVSFAPRTEQAEVEITFGNKTTAQHCADLLSYSVSVDTIHMYDSDGKWLGSRDGAA